ncbi:conserved hypothetical protein [Gammaproteobacteria bacterium]
MRAYYTARKLDEFGEFLVSRGKIIRGSTKHLTLAEIFALQGKPHAEEREKYFNGRLQDLRNSLADDEGHLDEETEALLKMGLSDFETYIEVLVAQRGAYHRRYIINALDSLMQKNRPGALLAQSRAKNAPRRFVLESRLLEVLLQIAGLKVGERGYHTAEMRIDDLLTFLRERYGLYIDRLPPGDGFGALSIDERKALRANVQAFTARLREIGFYRDLSDAYITQTVVPRYTIGATTEETEV